MFQAESFRRIRLEDSRIIIPEMTRSAINSCECTFGNLYVWGYPCGTKWQEYQKHFYFWLPCMDELFFMEGCPGISDPDAAELAEISNVMQKKGCKGTFFQVRQEYLEKHPDITEYFKVEQLPDASAEYIYSIEALVELKGEKLRKKRNLIKQFLREHPDAEIVGITPGKILNDCLELSALWRQGQENPDTIPLRMESEALSHLNDGFHEAGFEGIAVYTGGELAAYAIYSRINPEMYTESFEKSRFDFKGAAQFVNHEMAKRLTGKAKYINREQDLGSEGLRHAKLSYAPILLLKNFRLIPK